MCFDLRFTGAELFSDFAEFVIELSIAGGDLEQVELLIGHEVMKVGAVFKQAEGIPAEICKKGGGERKYVSKKVRFRGRQPDFSLAH